MKTCKYCGYTEPFYGELSNEIGLKRTVRQNKNSNPVPADDADPNKYKVANSSGITVDYTATMDMTKLKWEKQGSLYDDEITPWLADAGDATGLDNGRYSGFPQIYI